MNWKYAKAYYSPCKTGGATNVPCGEMALQASYDAGRGGNCQWLEQKSREAGVCFR